MNFSYEMDLLTKETYLHYPTVLCLLQLVPPGSPTTRLNSPLIFGLTANLF